MTERKLNASGWCVRNAYCPSQIGCATVSGGEYPTRGELCRACATHADDIALFERAEEVIVIADPKDATKPKFEWAADVDDYGPRVGFLQIHGERSSDTYRVEESGDYLGSRVATLIRLPSKKRPDTAAYTVRATASGLGECECMGHLRWGHCRHVDAVAALIRERLI